MAILLVDDDSAVRSSIAFALEADGFRVLSFATGEDLLAGLPVEPSQCLILDYRLPGMDGLALLRALRARDCRAPAILITSNPAPGLRLRVEQASGCILEKPLLSGSLAAAIRHLLLAPRGDA